jgi:hypothetical protein
MWNMKEQALGASAKENAQRLKAALEALPAVIPEVLALEVGLNVNPSPAACDVSLYTEFADEAALATYQKHPAHQDVAALVGDITGERHVVDYIAD